MKVRTLLAVTLATAAPAAAKPGHPRPVPPKVARVVAAKPAPAPKVPAVAAKPRTLPNGAPACGNVQSKMSAKQRAEREACLHNEKP